MKNQTEALQWMFKKNCSFSPKQVGLFYLAQSIFSLLVACFFIWQDIWLILPFTLLELVVLAIALLIYAKHATDYESILLESGVLTIERSTAGKVTLFSANPQWLKITKELTKNKLIGIQYQGHITEFGRFIHLSQREAFKKQLELSLKLNSALT